jgi:nucleotide-binding universal stress UspA family protein
VFEETIQQQIIEKEIDMLVMITYQKADGFWGKLFNPSVTKKMSYHSTIPVLAIPTKYNQTI